MAEYFPVKKAPRFCNVLEDSPSSPRIMSATQRLPTAESQGPRRIPLERQNGMIKEEPEEELFDTYRELESSDGDILESDSDSEADSYADSDEEYKAWRKQMETKKAAEESMWKGQAVKEGVNTYKTFTKYRCYITQAPKLVPRGQTKRQAIIDDSEGFQVSITANQLAKIKEGKVSTEWGCKKRNLAITHANTVVNRGLGKFLHITKYVQSEISEVPDGPPPTDSTGRTCYVPWKVIDIQDSGLKEKLAVPTQSLKPGSIKHLTIKSSIREGSSKGWDRWTEQFISIFYDGDNAALVDKNNRCLFVSMEDLDTNFRNPLTAGRRGSGSESSF